MSQLAKKHSEEKFIELRSPHNFFEIFSLTSQKISLRIADTILFENGQPKFWFFNSAKSKDLSILKKKSDKLQPFEISEYFTKKSGFKNLLEQRVDTLGALKDYFKNIFHLSQVVYVKLENQKIDFLNCKELNSLLMNTMPRILLLQSYIPNQSKSQDGFLVEYRQSGSGQIATWKFMKKVYSHVLIQNSDYPNMLEDASMQRNIGIDVDDYNIYKCNFQSLNEQLQSLTSKVIQFVEMNFQLKIYRCTVKYLMDQRQAIYFQGFQTMFIDLPTSKYANAGSLKQKYLNPNVPPIQFAEFIEDLNNSQKQAKMFLSTIEKNYLKLPCVIREQGKTYSKQLFTKLRLQKCQGDFCDYIMQEKNRGPLTHNKSQQELGASHQKSRKDDFISMGTNLPYAISNQLIYKTREHSQIIIKFLIKNRIFNKSSQYHFISDDQIHEINVEQEYPFCKRPFNSKIFDIKYNQTRVCKNCYIIYSMAQQYFNSQYLHQESQEKSQMPTKSQKFHTGIKSDIETNRLTLGFMRYDTCLAKTHPHQKSEQERRYFSSTSLSVGLKQQRLLSPDLEFVQAKKKMLENQSDSNYYSTMVEDRKRQKDSFSSDSHFRRSMKESYDKLLRKNKDVSNLIQNSSVFQGQCSFEHIRQLPSYVLSTPMKPLSDNFAYQKLQNVTIRDIQSIMGYPPIAFSTDGINMIIVNEKTAVPYRLITSLKLKRTSICSGEQIEEPGSKSQEDNESEESEDYENQDLVVVLHDIFDSFTEYADKFEDLHKKHPSTSFLLFNYPGQAYTAYSPDICYSNEYIMGILDRLLYEINDNRKWVSLESMQLRFMAFGYGGLILQPFLVQAYRYMSNIGSSLFFNAIFEIDSFIQATLKKSMETFHEFTLQDQALPYNFYSVITNSLQLTDEQLELKMKFNPIQLDGRIRLIDGCLNSQFVGEKFQRLPLTIYSVHTLRNCFVNISHADSLIMYFTDKEEEFKANIFIKKEVTAFKKVKKFIEGSHNLFESNYPDLEKILVEFLENQF